MNRLLVTVSLAVSFALGAAGCSGKPCDTSNDCGSSEVCLNARCSALSCSGGTYFAIDPSTGACRPLPACGNRDDVRGWTSCTDPCSGQTENSCIGDPRCQPVYTTTDSGPVGLCAMGGTTNGLGTKDASFGGCGPAQRTYDGCRPNPMVVDPCAGLAEAACNADPRCVAEQIAIDPPCNCPPNADCACGGPGGGTSPSFECRVKTCGDYDQTECAAHPECTGNPTPLPFNGPTPSPPPNPTPPSTIDGGVPFEGCFPQGGGSCNGMDEKTCLAHPECHPVGTACYCPSLTDNCKCSGGTFSFCEPDDGLHRCSSDAECGSNERCDNDEECAPPIGGSPVVPTPGFGAAQPLDQPAAPSLSCAGLCVPKGCKGYGEQRCNADPTCQPIYQLQCSPYGGGGVFNGGPCGGGLPPGPNNGAPIGCGGPCEPSFTGCDDANVSSVVDAGRSVLIRDPGIVDDATFAFIPVMSKLANASDPAPFVERWFAQMTADQTVDGRTAAARTGITQFLSVAPRRADGHLDLAALAFQVTSLSNRIDLAGPNDCGEARITYALAGGVGDRRHRMTIIVEMGQPDDGAQCKPTAQKWLALSGLTGQPLLQAARGIYLPLINAQHVNQVRTNEFLVGPDTSGGGPVAPDPNNAWELREWRFGADGDLHLALSKQAVDPTIATTDPFTLWAQTNQAAILSGHFKVPVEFLAVTSSENGSRLSLQPWDAQAHPDVEAALNQTACAGCHTTETNSAFAHVAERFGGLGRAQISDFLRQQLPIRAQNLFHVAQGQLTTSQRVAAAQSANIH
ncbi:MAG TPA: hypothetical protein VFF06_02785 [Polyangia bacterium]|nr:hypothetical protein [Polyangia bacterium]